MNENLTDEEIETMLEEGKTQMFNASILDDTTKAREQLNELKGKKPCSTNSFNCAHTLIKQHLMLFHMYQFIVIYALQNEWHFN